MDTEFPYPQEGIQPLDDEDSGSVYESSASSDRSSIHDEDLHNSHTTKLNDKGKNSSQKHSTPYEDSRPERPHESSVDNKLAEDAQIWAATFEPPETVGDIQAPQRRRQKLKRRAKPGPAIRAKRLRAFYNFDYRDLLNIDIQEAASKMYQEDYYSLQQSQIGSSIWTAEEKHIFFTALAIVGRNNIHEIAGRIESKSELEVQHYLQLLNQSKTDRTNKKSHETTGLDPVKVPAALEISEECSELLERAGDSIAARQDCAEAKVEEEKWGDIWLVTSTVSRLLDQRRMEDNGLEEMDEILPAANLFILKNWIELSENIFMNPAAPQQEDNWNSLAEPGEVPAVRATAFEDFHSLTVSITKRLISTTLYCTMSRLRARNSQRRKHAEVSASDVEAAVNILGLKADTRDFWIGCARRCNIQVVNDDADINEEFEGNTEETTSSMTYDEVEAALASSSRQFSRSRSMSRPPTMPLEVHELSPKAMGSPRSSNSNPRGEAEGISDSGSDLGDRSDTDFIPTTRDERLQLAKIKSRRVAEHAQDVYMEDVDKQASQTEEIKLWKLLNQTMPFELDVKMEENIEPPKVVRDSTEGENWRDYTEYWSQWELLESPVRENSFEINAKKWSKSGKMRKALAAAGKLLGPDVFAGNGEALENASDSDAAANETGTSNEKDAESEYESVPDEDVNLEVLDGLEEMGGSGYLSASNHSVLSEDALLIHSDSRALDEDRAK